jgi:hypothetical protein
MAEKAGPQSDIFWSGDPVRATVLYRRGISVALQPVHPMDTSGRFGASARHRFALAGHVSQKVDMTCDDDEENCAATDRFGIQGVPTIVFLDSVNREFQDSRVVGFLPPNEFLTHILPRQSALNEKNAQQDL